MWIVLILLILIYLILVKPFLQQRNEENFVSYLVAPDEIKLLINTEQVFELSEILLDLEINRKFEMCRIILQAIDSKGFSFANRVDKIRSEMRIRAGLGTLKNF